MNAPANIGEREAFLNLFAAGLERGLSVADAARGIGKSGSWGAAALAEIRKRLGAQAI
jgi:pilus assembly protein TadC